MNTSSPQTNTAPHVRGGILRIFVTGALATAALCVALAPSRAASPPEGLEAGPWVLAPYLLASFTTDDNIFRRPTEEDQEEISEAVASLTAYLPFRSSMLTLEYEADYFNYSNNDFSRDVEQAFTFDLKFNLAGGSVLRVSDEYTSGFSDVQQFDAGGERVFDGEPFDLNRFVFEMSRAIPHRKGYLLRVRHRKFEFVSGNDVPFFDYEGVDVSGEYRQPIAGSRWLTLTGLSRRLDHFDVVADAVSNEPFRKEVFDELQLGFRGLAAGEDPYFVRLGWGQFEYTDIVAAVGPQKPFSGLVGSFEYRLRISGTLDMVFAGQRRPLPSNFDTYYLINEFTVDLERKWQQYTRVGIKMLYSANSYGDLLRNRDGTPLADCSDFIRKDDRYRVEGYARWSVGDLMALRVSASRQSRNSNCDISEYEANILSANVEFGWF